MWEVCIKSLTFDKIRTKNELISEILFTLQVDYVRIELDSSHVLKLNEVDYYTRQNYHYH